MKENDQDTLQRILGEGKKEFLEKGFKGASIRNIVKRVGATTGAFYFYFPNKEALFSAIVLPTLNELKEIYKSGLAEFDLQSIGEKEKIMSEANPNQLTPFIDYIYEHFDVFKLLTTFSEGSSFENFIHEFVEIDIKNTMKYIETSENDTFVSGRLNQEFLHMVSSSFFSGLFEIVEHDMTRGAATGHVDKLSRFFHAGWETILNP